MREFLNICGYGQTCQLNFLGKSIVVKHRPRLKFQFYFIVTTTAVIFMEIYIAASALLKLLSLPVSFTLLINILYM